MITKPSDLITAQQAAIFSNKSKNTIRYWVRQGIVKGYRQDDSKQNSALMVSQQEIMEHLRSYKVTQPLLADETMLSLHHKLQELWDRNACLESKVSHLENEKGLLQDTLLMAEQMEERLRALCRSTELELQHQLQRIEKVNQHAEQLEERVQQLSSYVSLPWWRRWFSSQPMLTSSQA